jgi:hypothetical protein
VSFLNHKEMKRIYTYLGITILIIHGSQVSAQPSDCSFANITITTATTPSTCQANGTVTVTLEGDIASLFRITYVLTKSGSSPQSQEANNVFQNISAGDYSLTVKAFCSVNDQVGVTKEGGTLTVGGTYQVPVTAFNANSSRKSYNDCNTGVIALDVTRGSGEFTFTIIEAPEEVTVPTTVEATQNGNVYTLDGVYPAGGYTIEVYDGCYTSSVSLTLGTLSAYPTIYCSMLPVTSGNPTCSLVNWNIGTDYAKDSDLSRYFQDGMYEISISDSEGTPGIWITWDVSPVQYDFSPHTYADFYTANSLHAFLRVKGCTATKHYSGNVQKPAAHTEQTYARECDGYLYSFLPWSNAGGMWCYPLSYVLTDSDNEVVWSESDQSYVRQTTTKLKYGDSYTLTTTDNQGTQIVQTIIDNISPTTMVYLDACAGYQIRYSINISCYPVVVKITNSSGEEVYSRTVTSSSSISSATLSYEQDYTFTITDNTGINTYYTTTINRTSNIPASNILYLYESTPCSENTGRLRVNSSDASEPWPAGTIITITGPEGYTSQTYTSTSGTQYYYLFPATNLPMGEYTATIDLKCGEPLIATLTDPEVYVVTSFTYTSSISTTDCNGMRIFPKGTITKGTTTSTPYFRLTGGPAGYDPSVVGANGSLLLTKSGTYKLGIMRTNSSTGCVFRELTIEFTSPPPLQLNPSITSTYVCGSGETGNITIAAQNGKPPYKYELWDTDGNSKLMNDIVKNDDSPAYFHYGEVGATYRVVVSDACGNNFKQNITMYDLSTATIVHAPNSGQVCVNDAIRLTCLTLDETTYNWTGPGGWTSEEQNPVREGTQTSWGGTYTVTVQPEHCSANIVQSVIITVNPLPDAPSVSNPTLNYCPNVAAPSLSSATAATATSSGDTLRWYGSDGTTFIDPLAVISTSATGSTTCYVSEVNTTTGCESAKVTVTVNVSALPSTSPDLRIRICPDAGKSVNLSKYIDTTSLISIAWKSVAPNIPIDAGGTIQTNDIKMSAVHTLAYTVESHCATDITRKVYLEPLKPGRMRPLKDNIVICYLYAERLHLNQIFGIEAGGDLEFDENINPYISRLSDSPHNGAVIMNGKKIYEELAASGGDPMQITVTYKSGDNSCLAGQSYPITIVLIGN